MILGLTGKFRMEFFFLADFMPIWSIDHCLAECRLVHFGRAEKFKIFVTVHSGPESLKHRQNPTVKNTLT